MQWGSSTEWAGPKGDNTGEKGRGPLQKLLLAVVRIILGYRRVSLCESLCVLFKVMLKMYNGRWYDCIGGVFYGTVV